MSALAWTSVEDPGWASGDAPPSPELRALADRHMFLLRREEAPSLALLAAIEERGGTVSDVHAGIGMVVVTGMTDGAARAIADRFDLQGVARDAVARWIEPATDVQTARLPDVVAAHEDPTEATYYLFQWNMGFVGAEDAWPVTTQGEGTLVCVLDTGIDPYHPDLEGKIDAAKSKSFVPNTVPEGVPEWADDHYHGTLVASIISSNNIGTASVAPEATLCAVKVLDQSGSGTFLGMLQGVLWAAKVGADVINMSLSLDEPISRYNLQTIAMTRAVRWAQLRGAVVVAAAGNDALDMDTTDQVIVPGQVPGVIGVGSIGPVNQESFDELADYSNIGTRLVDLVAPGGRNTINPLDLILGPCSTLSEQLLCDSGLVYMRGAGTSFASPHVAGAAAVLKATLESPAFLGAELGGPTRNCIYEGAIDLGDPGQDPLFGRGKLNVYDALSGTSCGDVDGGP